MDASLAKFAGFPRVLLAQRERHEGKNYRRDNSKDPPKSALVIQHTESGAAWLKKGQEVFEVPSGHAMLFTHGEDSSYGAASERYQLKFVSISYTRSVDDLFKGRNGITDINLYPGDMITVPETLF